MLRWMQLTTSDSSHMVKLSWYSVACKGKFNLGNFGSPERLNLQFESSLASHSRQPCVPLVGLRRRCHRHLHIRGRPISHGDSYRSHSRGLRRGHSDCPVACHRLHALRQRPHDARRCVVRHVGPTADVGSRARSLRRRVAPDVVLCELLDVGWL